MFERSEFNEFAANVNFLSLRNLASNKLFFITLFSEITIFIQVAYVKGRKWKINIILWKQRVSQNYL